VASSVASTSSVAERLMAQTPLQLLTAANAEEPTREPTAAAPAPNTPPPPDDLELLNEAIASGDLDVVRAMIATGFPVNTDTDTSGALDPLAVAREHAKSGDAKALEIVAFLEAHGAVVHAPPTPDLLSDIEQPAVDVDEDRSYRTRDPVRTKEPRLDLTL